MESPLERPDHILEMETNSVVHVKMLSSALPPNIRIGGIFDLNDGNASSASEIAFKMAISDVNSDSTILKDTTLEGIANTTAPLDVKHTVESACYQIEKGVVTIIGPARSNVVKATSYISSGVDLPHIAFAATDPSLFHGHQQYPSMLRLSSSGESQSEAILAIMEHFNWRKAVMITSTDDYGSMTLEHLQQSSYDHRVDIVKAESFPALQDPLKIDFTRPLLSLRATKVCLVILNCPGKYAGRLLKVAFSLRMLTRDWVWIVSDAIATEENLYDAVSGQPKYLQGILGVVPSSTGVKNEAAFVTKWQANGGRLPLNVYSYKVYDAVWAVARALHEMATKSESLTPPNMTCVQCDQTSITKWADGRTLFERMKAVNFTGQLHPVAFTNEGNVQFEGYDVVNLQVQGFKTVGYWDSSKGLYVNKSDIRWIGQTAVVPGASPLSLENITFRVVTMPEVPFAIEKSGNFTGNALWEGFCMDMLQELAKRLGFNYVIHSSLDGNWGGKSAETQEWNGMIREIIDEEADMIVASFTISALRQEVIDMTIPYIDLGLTVLMKKKESEKGLLDFMDPYTNEVWFLLVSGTMYVGLLLTICNKLSPYGYYGQVVQADANVLGEDAMEELEENKHNMGLDESMWFSMGSLLGQGTDNQPKAVSGKILAAVWWIAGTIFVATYTANLAAFLTVTQSGINIRSLEDLVNQNEIKYGTVQHTQTSQFFEQSDHPLFQKMWSHMKSFKTHVESTKAALEKVQQGDYAFIWDSTVLEYTINQKPCNTFILDDLFSPIGYGISFPLNSPYTDVMSAEILKLREIGFLDKLKNKWFVQKGTCGLTNAPPRVVTVDINDVLGVYVLMAGGIVLGFIFLIVECLYFTRRLAKHPDTIYPTFKQAFKARMKLIWSDMKLRWISKRPKAGKD